MILRPKQPFLDWAGQLDDSGVLPDVDGEQNAYLVPDFEDDVEAERVLRLVFAEVFERELSGWHNDQSAWPRTRTLAVFRKWFHVELHSVVEDLCAYEIVDDEA